MSIINDIFCNKNKAKTTMSETADYVAERLATYVTTEEDFLAFVRVADIRDDLFALCGLAPRNRTGVLCGLSPRAGGENPYLMSSPRTPILAGIMGVSLDEVRNLLRTWADEEDITNIPLPLLRFLVAWVGVDAREWAYHGPPPEPLLVRLLRDVVNDPDADF